MAQDRLAQTFSQIARENRTGLILFLTAGFPDMDATLDLIPVLAQSGADCIELGVPFSDPLADGDAIQASSFRALQNHVTLEMCIDLVEQVRDQVPNTPLILMGYYNPFLSYGLPRFADHARKAGVDGVIVADLPTDESKSLTKECAPRGIHSIPMLAPTSTESRIERACHAASGFVYCVSLTGVTGARPELPPSAFRLLERVRKYTRLPLAVGFGISRREHLQSIAGHAEAAVVGSALIRVMMDSPREQLVDRARQYVHELKGAIPSVKGGPHR